MPDKFLLIERMIKEYWNGQLPEMFERELTPISKSDHIRDIIGPRRSGKTYLMFLTIRKLVEEHKVPKEATIYLNLENRRLSPVDVEHLDAVLELINSRQLIRKYGQVHLFLDEIQRLSGWERFIRSIYDDFKGRLRIYISGSSSKLLGGETATLLTGRHLTVQVFPLDFREFLRFKGLEVKDGTKADALSDARTAEIKGHVREYLLYGGFPEVVQSSQKDDVLSQLFTDIVHRDVVARASIRNSPVLDEFAQFLASIAGGLLSFHKMSKYLKSRNIKVSVPTLIRYFTLMKEAFLFFDNPLFSYNIRAQNQNPRKVYCIDNGFARMMSQGPDEDWGKLIENLVAVQFLRQGIPSYYWRASDQKEVDLILRYHRRLLPIQVCYDLSRADTREREFSSLLSCMTQLKLKDGWIINMDTEGTQRHDGKRVILLPLWKFLLFGLGQRYSK